jgi:hypothetical protein
MSNILKTVSVVVLALAFVGCHNNKSEKSPQPNQQQPQAQQQSPMMGQRQQAPSNVKVSDKEADKFADAAVNAQKVQMNAQKKMIGAIKDQGLDLKTYEKIAQSSQGGNAANDNNVDKKTMKKYQKATDSIKKIQKNTQKKITDAVNDAGMKMQRFQEISRATQQDTALQNKIRQKIQKKMDKNGMPQQPQSPSNQ